MSNVDNILGATGFYGPNKYTQYPNGVPMPGYVGTPTDAMGHPIQPPPGVTLNTPPPAPPAVAPGPDMSHGIYSMYGSGDHTLPMGQPVPLSSLAGGNYGSQNMNDAAGLAALMGLDPSKLNGFQKPQQQPAPATPTDPRTMDSTNAISLLSNPGHVTTPGANVPATVQQPDALTQFLSSQGGNNGNFTNQGFFDTLNALRAGGAPSSSLAPNPGGQIANAFAPAKVGGLGGLGGLT